MRADQMPTEQRCSLEEMAIRDEVEAFLRIMGMSLRYYDKPMREKIIAAWNRRPSADEGMRGALKVSIHGEQIIGGIRFDQGAYLILKTSETPDDITF